MLMIFWILGLYYEKDKYNLKMRFMLLRNKYKDYVLKTT